MERSSGWLVIDIRSPEERLGLEILYLCNFYVMCRTSLKVNKLVLSSQIFLNPSIPLFLCSVRPTEDWYEQLHPLILALKDCVGEVVNRAKQSLTFVLLQELAYSLPQCLMLTLRRDIVFSQAVGASCFWEPSTLMGCQTVSSVRKEIFLQ